MAGLLRQGRALLVRGRKLVRDTIVCRSLCCGCAEWRRFAQCPTGPLSCTGEGPPPQRFLWICREVTCLNGEPIGVGDTVLIGGLCWVAEDVTGTPPPGAEVRLSLDPLECTTGCADPRCPVGELYYVSRPCSPGIDPIWVCGVTECVIRSCHLLDPATGGVPFDQLPPGTVPVPLSSLGPPQASCCTCSDPPPGNCVLSPLTNPRPSQGDECYVSAQGEPNCCCTLDAEGTPIRRLRIDAYRTYQTVTHPTPGGGGTVEIDILPGSEQIDENGCASYIVRVRLEGFFNPPQTILSDRQALDCAACGSWYLRAPRMFGTDIRGISGPNYLVGFEGQNWTQACTGGGFVTVAEWSTNWTCERMRQTATYVWDDGQQTITTSFEFEAHTEIWGDTPDTCNQRCGGRIGKSKPAPFQADDFRSLILAA